VPYRAKTGAPIVLNLGQALAAEIVGTDAAWLGQFIPFLGMDMIDVGSMCVAGPPTDIELGPLDFLGLPWNSIGKLQRIAVSQIFPTYCELYGVGGGQVGVWGPSECLFVAAGSASVPFANTTVFGAAPAGTTQARYQWHDWVDRTAPWPVDFNQFTPAGANISHNQQGAGSMVGTLSGWITVNWTAGNHLVVYQYTDSSGTVCVQYNATSTPPQPTAPDMPEPDGLPAPVGTPTDATLASIAAELDRQETKLDLLVAHVITLAAAVLDQGGTPDDAVPVVPGTPTDLTDAIGFVVTVSNIPASRSLDFGEPQNIVKLGNINTGTAQGWYPSMDLTHSPMVIMPLAPKTTRVTITDLPPGVTATIATIKRERAPLG
jgi:hypothetical protein